MSEVIYIDVLVAINIFVTYLLLAASSFFSALQAKRWRLLVGSLLGGASALLIFLEPAPWWLFLLIKLLCSALIVWAAFGFGSRRRFARCFAAFFAVNFVFAGIMLALWLSLKPQGMFYQNGAVYFSISLPLLVVFACVCYALLRGAVMLLHRRHPGANACQATIQMNGNSITLQALYDSGNQLTDGFSGLPVTVAEFAALACFLPPELHGFFQGSQSLADLPSDHPWRARLRTIPFHALGQSGLLPAFRTDQVITKTKSAAQPTPSTIVAVTTDALSDGTYAMILQASMLER